MNWTESDAGWSGDETEPRAAGPVHHPRYEWTDVLGAGGMGEVHAVLDRRLGREVALKRVRAGRAGPEARDQLSWEAFVTGRLEHPAIVPVYDAEDPREEGFFFTMRLVRGRSLGAVIQSTPDLEDRLKLLRPMLSVCEAAAYAHSRGVLHLDLKPQNVMLGPFGEVQVVDWGLAAVTEEGKTVRAPLGRERVAGTPGFMSPAQLAGGPPSSDDDVYSLGCILRAILAPSNEEGLLGAPDELWAIVDKASAPDPHKRYASAVELAEDIERFLGARRVEAYSYSALDLLHRTLAAWRSVWIPGLLLSLVLAVSTTIGYRLTLQERTRAVSAERQAKDAFAAAESRLGAVLAAQASSAFGSGALAEAEVLAAHALLRREEPGARGILAAVRAAPHPHAVEVFQATDCRRPIFTGPAGFVCLDEGQVVYRLDDEERWRISFRGLDARRVGQRLALRGPREIRLVAIADGQTLAQMTHRYRSSYLLSTHSELWAGGSFGTVVKLMHRDGEHRTITACRDLHTHSHAVGRDLAAGVCSGPSLALFSIDRDEGLGRFVLPEALASALAVAISPDDRWIAVGGVDGHVGLVDVQARKVTSLVRLAESAIAHLSFHERGLIIRPEGGVTRLFDPWTGKELFRWPESSSDQPMVEGDAIITHSLNRRYTWRFRGELRPRLFSSDAGLSSVVVDDEWIAAARGDGLVDAFDRKDGHLLASMEVSDAVVKRLARGPGPWLYAVSSSVGGLSVIQTDRWESQSVPGSQAYRRVGVWRTGEVLLLGYSPQVTTWIPDRPTAPIDIDGPKTTFVDLELDPLRRHALIAAASGDVYRLEPPAHFRQVHSGSVVRYVASRSDGLIAASDPDGIRLFHPDDESERRLRPEEMALDLVFSEDGRTLLSAHGSGEVCFWDVAEARLLGRVRAHAGRASWVGVHRALGASAGWDGTVQLYDLDALRRPAQALAEGARSSWAMSVDEAIP